MSITPAIRVWNRACFASADRLESLREGDRALACVLRAHGLAMNGGTRHMLAALSTMERIVTVDAFAYFSLQDVVDLLQDAIANEETMHHLRGDDLDRAYARHVPDDARLLRVFRDHFAANPNVYAPLTDGDDDPRMKDIAAALAKEFGPKR